MGKTLDFIRKKTHAISSDLLIPKSSIHNNILFLSTSFSASRLNFDAES